MMPNAHIDMTTEGFVHPGPSKEEQFFYDNAGFSYNPRTETPEEGRWRCALALRKAELHAKREGWYVVWEEDPDAMWDDDVDRETTDYDQYVAMLFDADGDLLGALGSIDFGPDACLGYNTRPGHFEGQYPGPVTRVEEPYARVVEAEMADQAMHEMGV